MLAAGVDLFLVIYYLIVLSNLSIEALTFLKIVLGAEKRDGKQTSLFAIFDKWVGLWELQMCLTVCVGFNRYNFPNT